ncbi:MAG: DUF885 domain-containing protein [Pseudomonadota bacterium]
MNNYKRTALEQSLTLVNRASELAWQYLGDGMRAQEKGSLEGMCPDLSLEGAQKRATLGQDILDLLNQVDDNQLPHDYALTSKLMRHYAGCWSKDADRYWLAIDPVNAFFYGPFFQTAYTGGFVFSGVGQALAGFQFKKDGDGERYLAALAELSLLLRQVHERTAGQAERGIRIFKPQLPGSRSLLTGLAASMATTLLVDPSRLTALGNTDALRLEIEKRVADIARGFADLLAQLDDKYEALAPDGVGMSLLPGGADVYLDLATMHTTMDLTVQQIHDRGHARMASIEAQMAEVRKQLNFTGSAAEFAAHLRGPHGGVAKDADDVGERMRKHKDRLEQRYDEFFVERSTSVYDVERLPEALEGTMTWGYYSQPTPYEKRGVYYFNGSKLDSLAVIGAASLVFHELVPGHHLHMTLQNANKDLPEIRKNATVNAFNEGWAEYAATLTGEMGLYDDPYDRYGRLAMDAFLTSRLVVDTGMNALGWSLERAQQYLAEKTLCAPKEIGTDTIRYSCGIPAQALAYKLGDEEILRMRQRAMDKLKADFSYPHFHSAILDVGALPLPVLEWHLEKTYGLVA